MLCPRVRDYIGSNIKERVDMYVYVCVCVCKCNVGIFMKYLNYTRSKFNKMVLSMNNYILK